MNAHDGFTSVAILKSVLEPVLLNIAAWAFFHVLIALLCFAIPLAFFVKPYSWFRIWGWERQGELWSRWFLVKGWKGRLLDGSLILKRGYAKRTLPGTSLEDLGIFAAETKRAELTHWLSILPAPLFFLWNPAWAGWVMVLYAVLFNLPFIVAQRYNRARIERILKRTMKAKEELTAMKNKLIYP